MRDGILARETAAVACALRFAPVRSFGFTILRRETCAELVGALGAHRRGEGRLCAPAFGLRRIIPSSTAVLRIALSSRYAFAAVTALTSASRRCFRHRRT